MLLLSTNESFGKVIIEAGLMGVPTVASATLGAQTIIESEVTGLIVPINDARATREALEQLYSHREVVVALGQKAHSMYLQKYQRQQTIDAILNFWLSLVH
jgi:glycosyltransferase involved in cell wall biosynthesis